MKNTETKMEMKKIKMKKMEISFLKMEAKKIKLQLGKSINHIEIKIMSTNTSPSALPSFVLVKMIDRDLISMKEDIEKIQKFVDHMNVQINQASEKFEELKTRGGRNTNELGQLKMSVKKLKSQIPSKLKIHYDDDSKPHGSVNSSSSNYPVDINKAGDLHKFDYTTALEDIRASFCSLPENLRDCLNLFLMFPETVTLKKRLVIYWWIGQGLLSPIKSMDQSTKEEIMLGKTVDDFAKEILDELTAKGFIEPIYKNCGLVIHSYRMRSNIHFALKLYCSIRVGPMDSNTQILFQIFNFGEAIVHSRFEQFFKFDHFKVVYLGKWQNSVTHHIEIADIKILNGLKNMKQLRFLSFQGISLITELPRGISRMTNLKILDLKACHDLEVVPDWIGLLKNLTHLDMSECYFLDHMPKGLGSLLELQVLKGFIIGDFKDKNSCTINDLTKLSKLRKLSIYTSMKEFPTNKHLCCLQRLNTLQKLKISWSSCILRGEIDDIPEQARPQPRLHVKLTKALSRSFTEQHDLELPLQLELPSSLQKLELECFPEMITPSWLRSSNLNNLKKLCIRGGRLRCLDEITATTVEMLQLKYLSQLRMHWMELKILFPNLIYLEKVECSGLTSFPCDENGVWISKGNMQN